MVLSTCCPSFSQLDFLDLSQQSQAQTTRNAQPNASPFSLQAQASSQQLSSTGIQQISGPQTHPALHSVSSSQNLKVSGSSSGQSYVPQTFQAHSSTGLSVPENNIQKPREVETRADGKGPHSAHNYATTINMPSSERDGLMATIQTVNKQQNPAQLPQSSLSISGSTSSYSTLAYPRPSMSSASLRPPNLDSHARQVSHNQGLGTTQIRPAQSTNISTYEQNSANETKKQQGGPLSSHPATQHNPIAWPLSANKEQKSSGLQSTSFVKQEVVDQPSELPNKSHFVSSENPSFGMAHFNQGNSTLGSSSIVGQNQVSGSVPSQDHNVQVSICKFSFCLMLQNLFEILN